MTQFRLLERAPGPAVGWIHTWADPLVEGSSIQRPPRRARVHRLRSPGRQPAGLHKMQGVTQIETYPNDFPDHPGGQQFRSLERAARGRTFHGLQFRSLERAH